MMAMVALGVLLGSAGCGGEKEAAAPEVAGISGAGAAAGAGKASAAAKVDRPRERLDGTPEDYEALLGGYNKCLKDRGAKPKGELDRGSPKSDFDKFEKEDKYCMENFGPLPPWEKDPANPKHKDFNRAVVACLKQKGVVASLNDQGEIEFGADVDPDDITEKDQTDVAKAMDETPKCERENAAAGN